MGTKNTQPNLLLTAVRKIHFMCRDRPNQRKVSGWREERVVNQSRDKMEKGGEKAESAEQSAAALTVHDSACLLNV